jgi:hypothetical protein
MNILIVGKNPQNDEFQNPHYRGINRTQPQYCETLPSDHEVNRLYGWYFEETDRKGFVQDLLKARRFIELLHKCDPKREYELLELVNETDKPEIDAIFLGFDLVYGNCDSLIQSGFKNFAADLDIPRPVQDLADLINFTFAPQLNGQGLFQIYEVASLCLKSMAALQAIHPYFYGGDDPRYRIIGIHLL